jgi:hypothetical protein
MTEKIVRQLDLLDSSDLSQVTEIIDGRNTLMRSTVDAPMSAQRIKIYKENKSELFGYFDGDILVSFLSVSDWEFLPYYTISNFFVRTGSMKYFSVKHSGVADLFARAIEHMEGKQYYTFYFVRAETHWPIKNKKRNNLGFEDSCPPYTRYIRTLEEIIEPGCASKYNRHHRLLGSDIVEHKSVVIRCTLPNELRHWNYEFQ